MVKLIKKDKYMVSTIEWRPSKVKKGSYKYKF
jgi:hypothetical protein